MYKFEYDFPEKKREFDPKCIYLDYCEVTSSSLIKSQLDLINLFLD